EFPCAADRRCVDPVTRANCGGGAGCICILNACLTAGCDPPSQTCQLVNGAAACGDRCRADRCAAPTVCVPATGQCVDCYAFGCPDGQLCLGSPGACKADPCAGVSCGAGSFCVN